MIDTEALKRKILDLAIKGKLVPQDPADEPASELLKRIKSERDRLIDEGKIKGKKDNCYYENIGNKTVKLNDKLPFDIPSSWLWIRFKSISSMINGYAFKKEDFKSSGSYKVIKIANITPYGLNLTKCNFTNFNAGKNYVPKKGDLIIALSGATTGKMCFYDLDDSSCFINQRTCLMRFLNSKLIDPTIYSFIASTKTSEILENSYGGAQPNISSEKIENFLIPLIPFNEQIRIKAVLDKALKIVLDIENSQKQLITIKQLLRNKIISLGINGKLLNADDNYYSTTDDNYYSTKIASISSLLDESFYGDGNWVLSDDMEIDSKLKLIQLGNIGDGSYIDKKLKSVKNKYKTNNDCKYIHNGYLLINRLIANRMYACIFESELNNEYITSVDVCWVKPNKIINLHYLLYIMLSIDTQQQVLQKASGSTRKRISKKNLININFNYFEDLDVQQTIVASVEKTLKLLNY